MKKIIKIAAAFLLFFVFTACQEDIVPMLEESESLILEGIDNKSETPGEGDDTGGDPR